MLQKFPLTTKKSKIDWFGWNLWNIVQNFHRNHIHTVYSKDVNIAEKMIEKYILNQHHPEEKAFQCDLCGKCYVDITTLMRYSP